MSDRALDRMLRAGAWYRRLLALYPPAFRHRFSADLLELFSDLYSAHAAGASAGARLRFWIRIIRDTSRHALAERLVRRTRVPLATPHAKGPSPMSLWIDDARHAVRALGRQPVLAAIILVTLSLAIGASAAIFTAVHAVWLRPMPFADPSQVIVIREVDPHGRDSAASIAAFEDWRRTLRSISGVSVMAGQTVNLTSVAEPDRLRGGFVTAGFFDLLGVQPVVGRGFVAGEDLRGARKTVVLAHATWQQRFGADPGILGRQLVLNNEPHEVIGVLPRSFEFPIDTLDVWVPYGSYPVQDAARGSRNSLVIGRVQRGVPLEQAEAELRAVGGDLARAYPETNTGWSARLIPFHELAVGSAGRNLRLLAGAMGLVLLIACANIANLLLARASGRQREMAVRAALGASRQRLVRQLLTESVLLSLAGGVLGLLLGAALSDAMIALLPDLPRADRVAPDATVVAFTAALSIATGLLFGTFPALRTSRPDLRGALNDGGRGGESRRMGRVRSALVVGELALSLVLLVGAGLLIQSLMRLTRVDLGFDPERLLTLEYRLPRNKYSTVEAQWEFHGRVIERIQQVPGVEIAALARAMPQSGNGGLVGFWRTEDARPPQDALPRAQYNAVSQDYFRAMGIPILAGRVCTSDDTADAPLTLIVNRVMADRIWPGQDPIGKRLRAPDFPGEAAVAGVVANTRPQLLSQPFGPQVYGCLSQQPGIFVTVVAKTAGEPMSLAASVRQAVWSVDPDQPMWKVRSSEAMIAGAVQSQRFVMLLMTSAAVLALVLAALGTYGVLSYTVHRRARELGVRMALGASRRDVARLVLGHTGALVVIGIAGGIAGALALSQLLTTHLYEVSARDPRTYIVTAGALALVALFAAWLPMRRATSLDPAATLRSE